MEESASGRVTLPKLDQLREVISKLQRSSLQLDAEKVAAEEAFFKALQTFSGSRLHSIDHIRNVPESSLNSDPLDLFSFLGGIEKKNNLCEPRERSPLCDMINTVIRIKNVNRKLRLFEQGFISEEGIKDREWYRHLGVAPGKYLGRSFHGLVYKGHIDLLRAGYGATTLPALSEAVLYERNATLVEHEVTRLVKLVGKLAVDLIA